MAQDSRKKDTETNDEEKPKRRRGRAVIHLSHDEVMSMVEKAKYWDENPAEFRKHIRQRGYVWLQMADLCAESGAGASDIARMMKEYSVLADRLVALEAIATGKKTGAPVLHQPDEE